MRIAVDARPLLTPNNGIGRYTLQLIDRLTASAKHEWLLYFDRPPEGTPERTSVQTRSAGPRFRGSSTFYAQTLFGRWANEDRADVYWSPRHHLPMGLGRVPAVVTIHDLVWKRYSDTMKPLGLYVERLLFPRSVRSARGIIAVSEFTRAELCTEYPEVQDRIDVIHEAPFVQAQDAPRTDSRRRQILFVGTFEPRKNISRLLRAYARLRVLDHNAPDLLLVGQAHWRTDVQATIADLGISSFVSIDQTADDERLARYYAESMLLALPSLYEGFGLPIIEAMASGLPVMTSSTSATAEIAGGAGLLVDPLSVDSIMQGLRQLSSDSEHRCRLSRMGLERASAFSWDVAAEATEAALARAARRR